MVGHPECYTARLFTGGVASAGGFLLGALDDLQQHCVYPPRLRGAAVDTPR